MSYRLRRIGIYGTLGFALLSSPLAEAQQRPAGGGPRRPASPAANPAAPAQPPAAAGAGKEAAGKEAPASGTGATAAPADQATDNAAAAPDDDALGGSSPEALVAYSDAANFQNAGEFALAAEEWQKFLDKFAQDPKALDAKYNWGVCLIQTKDYPGAIERLQAVKSEATDKFERLEDVYLNLGSAQYSYALQNQPEQFKAAAETFAAMIERFPMGKYHDDGLFFRGEALSVLGQGAEAAAMYEELLAKHADSELRPDALYALGATYESLGKFAEAEKIYDEFLAKHADRDPATEVRMRKAETVMRQGNFADAEKRFAEVAAVPNFSLADHAHFRQAFCVSRQDRYAEAGDLFAQLVEKFPQSNYVGEATIAAARSYYRGEKLDAAETWLVRAKDVPNSPYLPEIIHWRARILLKQGKPADALALVREGLPQAAGHAYLPSLKLDAADAQYEIPAEKTAAVDAYAQIAEEHQDLPIAAQALYNAAYGALELKQFERASQLAKLFGERYPEHRLKADVQHVLGESLVQLGKFEEAGTVFNKLRTDVSEPDEQGQWTLRQLLSTYLARKYDETIRTAQEQLPKLTAPAEKAEAYYLMGLAQLAAGSHAQAEQSLHQALGASEDWSQRPEVMLNLAVAQNRATKPLEAQKTLTELLQKYPQSDKRFQARYRLAEIVYGANQYEEAAKLYGELIQELGESPSGADAELLPLATYGQGWSLVQQRQYPAAIKVWDSFVERFRDHRLFRDALYARALAHQQSGKFDAGIRDADTVLELVQQASAQAAGEPSASGSAAADSARTGSNGAQPSAAAQLAQQRLDTLYVKALCQVGLKEFPAAQATLESILAEQPSYHRTDRVLYELAWAQKSQKQDDKALATFQQLTEKFPTTALAAEASYHQGERLYSDKKYDQAVEAYTRALIPAATTEVREKSLYKLAWSHFQRQEYDASLTRFDELLSVAPSGQLAADAQFMRAEALFQKKDYAAAYPAFTSAKKLTQLSEQMSVLTLLHGGQTAAQLKKWEESLQWLDELIKKHPDTKLMSQIKYEQAAAHQNLGRTDEALKLYTAAAEELRNEVGARARFMVGEILFEKQQYAAAVREFQRVVLGYGGNQAPEAVKSWQAKAGIEAGRCFDLLASQEKDQQRKSDYVRRAEQYFRYVTTEHPGTDEATAADKQLEKYGR